MLILSKIIQKHVNKRSTISLSPSRYYTISASKVFRANSNYHISVSSHDADKAAEVQVGITGEQAGGSPYSNLKTITIEPDGTKIVEIDVRKTK